MRQLIYEPGDRVDYVYFPSSGVISMLILLEDGEQIELASIGNEGMAEITVMFGLNNAPYRALVQVPGEALRMSTATFRDLLRSSPAFQAAMGRYLTGLFALVAQSAVCNRLHPIQERCARWLLMTQDRVGTDSFPITQAFLADMLGVRRPSVTAAEGLLKSAGLIDYKRGRVTIVDRLGLEEASCECYAAVKRTFDDLFDKNTAGEVAGSSK